MKFSAEDYNVLSYVLKKNFMSYEYAIAWAYTQYTDQGIDPFIEKLSLASDVAEMIESISNTYQVYGEPSNEFLAGEAAKGYSEETLSLYAAISRILFDLDLELPEEELQELYIAEDYFGWHNSAESQAIVHAMPCHCLINIGPFMSTLLQSSAYNKRMLADCHYAASLVHGFAIVAQVNLLQRIKQP